MALPQKYLCCDLRLGVFIYGIIMLFVNLAGLSFLISLYTQMDEKFKSSTYFYVIVGATVFGILLLVLKYAFFVGGVVKNNLNMLLGYFVMLSIDMILQGLTVVLQVTINPVIIPLSILIMGIVIFNLLCVKSLYDKMKMETFNRIKMDIC